MAQSKRAFFLAGIALEEANERRDRARAKLREVAKRMCPDEVAALDAASDAVSKAEAHLAHVMMAMVKGEMGKLDNDARAWAEDHARTCDDPNCEIKKSVRASAPAGAGGAAN